MEFLLRVFNSIVELNTRRVILYLQATMFYFVYHINTIALYWQEKSTLSMNENKRIDTPNKNRKVRGCTQDENMWWITTKTNNGPKFALMKNFFTSVERHKDIKAITGNPYITP